MLKDSNASHDLQVATARPVELTVAIVAALIAAALIEASSAWTYWQWNKWNFSCQDPFSCSLELRSISFGSSFAVSNHISGTYSDSPRVDGKRDARGPNVGSSIMSLDNRYDVGGVLSFLHGAEVQ